MTDLERASGLKLYSSHKEVLAVKIESIIKYDDMEDNSQIINEMEFGDILVIPVTPAMHTQLDSFVLDKKYVDKHNPQVGGYYVQYKDGYQSWSPAEAFEDGYTEVK